MVAHYKGLTVSEISDLRIQIKASNSNFKVTKNTLTRRAIKDTNFEVLEKFFVGPTSLAYSDDPVTTSKVMVDFAKDNENLKILGGAMGDKELSVDEIKKTCIFTKYGFSKSSIIRTFNLCTEKYCPRSTRQSIWHCQIVKFKF